MTGDSVSAAPSRQRAPILFTSALCKVITHDTCSIQCVEFLSISFFYLSDVSQTGGRDRGLYLVPKTYDLFRTSSACDSSLIRVTSFSVFLLSRVLHALNGCMVVLGSKIFLFPLHD